MQTIDLCLASLANVLRASLCSSFAIVLSSLSILPQLALPSFGCMSPRAIPLYHGGTPPSTPPRTLTRVRGGIGSEIKWYKGAIGSSVRPHVVGPKYLIRFKLQWEMIASKNMYPAAYTRYDYNYDNNVKNPTECIMYTHNTKYGSHIHPTCTPWLTN